MNEFQETVDQIYNHKPKLTKGDIAHVENYLKFVLDKVDENSLKLEKILKILELGNKGKKTKKEDKKVVKDGNEC